MYNEYVNICTIIQYFVCYVYIRIYLKEAGSLQETGVRREKGMTGCDGDLVTVEEYRVAAAGAQLERVSRRHTALPADHVLIEICAISLNYRDLLYVDEVPRAVGLVPCSDAAGVVRAVGADVTDWGCGERVVVSFFTAWRSGRYDPAYRASALG
jgi:hypothetical protein